MWPRHAGVNLGSLARPTMTCSTQWCGGSGDGEPLEGPQLRESYVVRFGDWDEMVRDLLLQVVADAGRHDERRGQSEYQYPTVIVERDGFLIVLVET
jgi:hypothetical protein